MAQAQQSEVKVEKYKFRANQFQGRNSTSLTKDQRLINCYIESIEPATLYSPGRVAIVKRPGVDQFYANTSGVGRGIWAFNDKIWHVIGDVLYKSGVAEGTVLTTTTGYVGSVGCTIAGIPALFFCDGTKGYVINSSDVVTLITDVDFPTPHIPTPVYIDGYVLVARAASADIYNSDLDAPTAWTASNFITAELFPDIVTSLARQNNQVVAFGEKSTEFFYDAANPTGTPLSRNTGAFLQVGCASPYAVGQNERFCIFVGQSDSGGRTVWKLDGFQPEQISTESIDRVLDAEGTSITSATSMLLRLLGHFFYVLHLSNRTFVYDIKEKLWHEWANATSNRFAVAQIDGTAGADGITGNFVINGLSQINGHYINKPAYISLGSINANFFYAQAADLGDGRVFLLGGTNGTVGKFNETKYQDENLNIYCQFTTPIIDFDTYQRKFLHQLTVVGDLSSSSALFIRWSDDDYQSYSSYKSLSRSSRPVFTRLGMFRRRNFDFAFFNDLPFRMEGLDLVYTTGET